MVLIPFKDLEILQRRLRFFFKYGSKTISNARDRAECLSRVFAEKFSDPRVDNYPEAACYEVDNLSTL